ncbi:MAG: galactokinase family protein [Candidatus Aminicenantales bacterium]
MDALILKLRRRHRERFGLEPVIVSYAPGRVEILGNHTDYNEGFVLSAAIDAGVAFGLNPSGAPVSTLFAADFDESVQFPADRPGRTDTERWSNYARGVYSLMRIQYGFEPEGFLATQIGDIPIGSGLSSSAALDIAAALAFAAFHGLAPDKLDLARIGQKAEHEYAGVNCGLLDQISSLFGRAYGLVFTDFRSLRVETVPRRRRCEQAAAYFARVLGPRVKTLRDVSWADLERHRGALDPAVWNRAAHPVGEDERVLKGVELLRKGDAAAFGRLMFESHKSSQIYFQNSCPELDTLVDAARSTPGVLGARLSGGGFGGSIVALIEEALAEPVARALAAAYEDAHGHAIEPRLVVPSAGARLV